MTSTIEPNNQTVSICHLDTREFKTLPRLQMIQLMYVLYSDRLMIRGGTPTQFFNLHFSDKRKTKKFSTSWNFRLWKNYFSLLVVNNQNQS